MIRTSNYIFVSTRAHVPAIMRGTNGTRRQAPGVAATPVIGQGAQTWARATRNQPLWRPLPSQDWARNRCDFRLKSGPILAPVLGLETGRDLTEFGIDLAQFSAKFLSRIWTSLDQPRPHVSIRSGPQATPNPAQRCIHDDPRRPRELPHGPPNFQKNPRRPQIRQIGLQTSSAALNEKPRTPFRDH